MLGILTMISRVYGRFVVAIPNAPERFGVNLLPYFALVGDIFQYAEIDMGRLAATGKMKHG